MLDSHSVPQPFRSSIHRRQFLRTALAATALGSMWDLKASVRSRRRTNGRGLVIGAGIAGIAAARGLAADGYTVTVLEGRDRIGGRIWTDRSLGTPIDLGASWIHGASGNPITVFARKYDVETAATDYDDIIAYDHDGARLDDADLEEIESGLEEVLAGVERIAESSSRDVTVGDAVRRFLAGERLTAEEQRALDWAMSTLELAAGASMDDLSLFYMDADDGFGGGDRLFPGGYDQIVTRLADGLDVRFEQTVRVIEHGPDGVRVTTDDGVFEADGAVVTLPLGVLKSGVVEFRPALPSSKTRAIERLGMGVLDKVAVRFERPFWPHAPHFFGYLSKTKGDFPTFMNWHHYAGAPILIGFVSGDSARRLERLGDDTVRNDVMRVLRACFGPSVPDPVAIKVTRWGSDPFAGGSYSHVPVGATPHDFDALATPLGERLFFAGEATNRRYPATVHGAFLSGVREAERIAAL